MLKKPKCKIKGCSKETLYLKHGLCSAHFMRWRRSGNVGGKKVRKYEKIEAFTLVEQGK